MCGWKWGGILMINEFILKKYGVCGKKYKKGIE